ncbi:MAG TPA: hypothetical protein VK506_05330 [Conexibacter sp.]|nr:hypothetical protein [Conexibacter sp.]
MTDQPTALRLVEDLVDREDWRADLRATRLAMLRRLVGGMSWRTGLITGVTRTQLGEAAGRRVRTVSKLLAWAVDAGLLVVVERGASASFLGSRSNRAPSYAVVHHGPVVLPPAPGVAQVDAPDHALPVDGSCNPPQVAAGTTPLTTRGLLRSREQPTDWPAWQIPATGRERTAAASTLLARMGVAHRVPLWRARAMLRRWWDDGACVAGLLHAVDHLPGDATPRGDAIRGAANPLAVLGHRLRPWRGRLAELPAHLAGLHGDYRARQAAALAAGTAAAAVSEPTRAPMTTPEVRATARAELGATLLANKRRRAAAGTAPAPA